MLRLTRRSLWEHKRRLVSTIVAIVLGVGFMAGTFVLSDTMDQRFDDLFATANEEVDAQVQGKVLFSDPFGGMGDQRGLLDPSAWSTRSARSTAWPRPSPSSSRSASAPPTGSSTATARPSAPPRARRR